MATDTPVTSNRNKRPYLKSEAFTIKERTLLYFINGGFIATANTKGGDADMLPKMIGVDPVRFETKTDMSPKMIAVDPVRFETLPTWLCLGVSSQMVKLGDKTQNIMGGLLSGADGLDGQTVTLSAAVGTGGAWTEVTTAETYGGGNFGWQMPSYNNQVTVFYKVTYAGSAFPTRYAAATSNVVGVKYGNEVPPYLTYLMLWILPLGDGPATFAPGTTIQVLPVLQNGGNVLDENVTVWRWTGTTWVVFQTYNNYQFAPNVPVMSETAGSACLWATFDGLRYTYAESTSNIVQLAWAWPRFQG